MKALILFHGYSSDNHDYDIIRAAVEHQYDYVVSPNFPGHDTNDLSEFNCTDTIRFAEDLCEEVFKNYDTVDIIGYSMGGAITSMLATMYKFRKVILISPANKYGNFLFGLKRVPFYLKKLINMDNKEADYKVDVISQDDIDGVKFVYKNRRKYSSSSVFNFLLVIDYCNKKVSASKEKLNDITVIYGCLDQIVPYKSIEFLEDYCKNLKVHKIEYASHFMMTSQYAPKVTDIVLDELGVEKKFNLSQVMNYKNFCVVGDVHNKEKYAYKIVSELEKHDYNVEKVTKEDKIDNTGYFEILNLCINPNLGLQLIKETTSKIECVLIQPGAESDELITYLKENDIDYLLGCSLEGIRLFKN